LRNLAAHPPRAGDGDPVAPLATILAHVAGHPAVQQAGPLAAVSLSVPAGWGPRRRQYLYQAAERAGLPAPHLVTVPAAIATYTARLITPVPPGALLLVCNLHSGSSRLVGVGGCSCR
jgi:molecular chaperone DnaK (HSP70)